MCPEVCSRLSPDVDLDLVRVVVLFQTEQWMLMLTLIP
jgi:hypothetical protein